MKRKLLDVASEVCGYTKGKPRHKVVKRGGGIKMWMWLCVERESYLGFQQSRNEEDMKKCCEAKKKDAKRVVYMVMDQKAREAVEKVNSCRDCRELFRIAKQRVGEKKDVGVSCLKDESEVVKVSVNDRKKILSV